MKGWRFYEEYKTSKHKVSRGTVLAFSTVRGWRPIPGGAPRNECIGSVYNMPNAPVAGDSVSLPYLQRICKRISEAKAREIHPMLFEYLEGGQ